jgi:hypothetical protein
MVTIAVIPKEKSDEARQCAWRLEDALPKAHIGDFDQEKESLDGMAVQRINIPDEKWRRLLNKIRSAAPGFKADYLLDREAQDTVLKMEWAREDDHIIEIFKTAHEAEGIVLELSVSGNDDDEP